ncbi:hypothetical protein COOONC_26447 [Cooperia oncophora]
MDDDNLFGGDLSESSSDEEQSNHSSKVVQETAVVKEEKPDTRKPRVSFTLADDEESKPHRYCLYFHGLGAPAEAHKWAHINENNKKDVFTAPTAPAPKKIHQGQNETCRCEGKRKRAIRSVLPEQAEKPSTSQPESALLQFVKAEQEEEDILPIKPLNEEDELLRLKMQVCRFNYRKRTCFDEFV